MSWTGRTDTNKRVVFPSSALSSPVLSGLSRDEAERFAGLRIGSGRNSVNVSVREEMGGSEGIEEGTRREEDVGDKIEESFNDSSDTSLSGSTSTSRKKGKQTQGQGQGQGRAHVDVSADLEDVAHLVRDILRERKEGENKEEKKTDEEETGAAIQKGSYVVVKILSARGHTLRYALHCTALPPFLCLLSF